jgi:hypothetical protein
MRFDRLLLRADCTAVRIRVLRLSVLVTAVVIVAARCAPIQSQSKQVDAQTVVVAGPPVLEAVRPDSVVLPSGGIAAVTITGTGFIPGEPGKNTVHFNGAVFPSIGASTDGRRILFNIPDAVNYGGGAPPSSLAAGRYLLSVETSSGTSNAISVSVYR